MKTRQSHAAAALAVSLEEISTSARPHRISSVSLVPASRGQRVQLCDACLIPLHSKQLGEYLWQPVQAEGFI